MLQCLHLKLFWTKKDPYTFTSFTRSSQGIENQVGMNTLLKLFASKIGGKGGGKPNFAQGGGNVEGMEDSFDIIFKKIEENLKKT